MKTTVKFNNKKCLMSHSWDTVWDNGFTVYQICKDCGCRKTTQPVGSGYQPVDWDWLYGKHETIST